MIYDAHFGDYIDYLTKNLDSEDFYKFFENIKTKVDKEQEQDQKDSDLGIAYNSLEFMVYVKVPGFDKKDIDLTIEGDELIIQAEKVYHPFIKGEETIIQDFNIDNINKRVKIPESFIKGDVKAFLYDGILKIYIKKNKDFTKIIEIE